MRIARSLALLVALLIVHCGMAQARPTVMVGGTVVMKFEGASADQRAAIAQRNLDAAIRQRKPVTQIQAVDQKGTYTIVWGGMPICTIDEAQAKANKCPAKELAFRWVKNLREAAKAGFLGVNPDTVVMGLGTSRALKIQGIATGPIEVEAEGSGITATLSGDTISVKGTAIGRFVVKVTRDGATVNVPIAVKESAGVIPDRVYQTVTGNPANRDILEEATALAARTNVVAKPGATIEIKASSAPPASLATGSETVVKLAISIEGPNYFTVSKILEVVLKNEAISLQPPTLLMVSNRPEKILGEGVLFKASFKREQPTRLLYSHVNGMGSTQYLWVNLTNPSDQPARILIVQGDGGPAPEELYVGHRCNTRFLEDLVHNQGIVLNLPPHRTFSLGQYRLPAKELVSGLAQLQLLSGDEVMVTVETSPEREKAGRIVNVFDAPFNPFRIHPKGIFATPNIVVNEKFVVGSTDSTEIPFGKSPWLIDPVSGEPNTGNYGVMYELRLELQNPTPQSQKVSMFFQPVNGVALGSFLVEGKLTETNCLKPPARQLISTVELLPQQTRTIRIMTLPQAGSHYPARILIQSTIQETHRDTGGT